MYTKEMTFALVLREEEQARMTRAKRLLEKPRGIKIEIETRSFTGFKHGRRRGAGVEGVAGKRQVIKDSNLIQNLGLILKTMWSH